MLSSEKATSAARFEDAALGLRVGMHVEHVRHVRQGRGGVRQEEGWGAEGRTEQPSDRVHQRVEEDEGEGRGGVEEVEGEAVEEETGEGGAGEGDQRAQEGGRGQAEE